MADTQVQICVGIPVPVLLCYLLQESSNSNAATCVNSYAAECSVPVELLLSSVALSVAYIACSTPSLLLLGGLCGKAPVAQVVVAALPDRELIENNYCRVHTHCRRRNGDGYFGSC